MQNYLVLCSGGLKSAFMTGVAIREGRAELLFVDHGQSRIGNEAKAAAALANYYNVSLHAAYKRPTNNGSEPLLNIVSMLTLALPIARQLHCSTIYYGFSQDDLERTSELATVERTESFLNSLNMLLLAVQTKYDGKGGYLGQVEVEFPLFKLKEHHIIRLGNEYYTPWHLTWSCENTDLSIYSHCGGCFKCIRRQIAFKVEGHSIDPVQYDLDVATRRECLKNVSLRLRSKYQSSRLDYIRSKK